MEPTPPTKSSPSAQEPPSESVLEALKRGGLRTAPAQGGAFFARYWTIARFRDVEIRLHISMLLLLPLVYLLFRPDNFSGWLLALFVTIGLFACVLLHEMGHALMAQRLGIRVKQITLWPLGGFTQLTRSASKPLHDFLIFGAGPLVSLVLALLFGILWLSLDQTLSAWFIGAQFWSFLLPMTLLNLAVMNAILVVFNLLPIYPLDGGGMLHALAEMVFGKSAASLLSILVAIPFLLGLVAFSLWTGDYLLFAITLSLAFGVGMLEPGLRHRLLLVLNYLFKRSGFHHLNEDYDEAIRHHSLAIEKNPNDIASLLGRAIAYINTNEIQLAERDLEAVLALAPQHAIALELRGELYSLNKQYDLALEIFNRVRALKPEWMAPYFDTGGIYLDQKEYEKALKEFDQALDLEKQQPLLYLGRSIAHFYLGNLPAARRDQAEALRLSPRHALMMIDVNLNLYQDTLEWALDYYAWVLGKNPKQWLAYLGRADAYRVNGRLEDSLADYDRALEIAPREAISYLRRGQAYQSLGNPARARDDFQRALELSPKAHLRRQAERLLAQISSPPGAAARS